MNEESYRKLAEHLDRLPEGFASTDPEVALRLLKRLFTPEEAELAIHLTLEREDARSISGRAGIPLSEAEQRLAEMARKGLIFSVYPQDGPPLYQAVPFVVGIYEFQVNDLDPDLVQALDAYWPARKPQPETLRQMRTIPVGQSIEPHLEALPYERVDALLKAQDRFAVAPCICRRHAALKGKGCHAPEESCLLFGEWADFYVRHGRARAIDRVEVHKILDAADAANLILQPNNSRNMAFLCCCCSCCCGVLNGLKRHPRPAEAVASAFMASLDAERCLTCRICLERCGMQALTVEDGHAALNPDRCIGCGLCVTTCPAGALTLKRRGDRDSVSVPEDMNATWQAITRAQADGTKGSQS